MYLPFAIFAHHFIIPLYNPLSFCLVTFADQFWPPINKFAHVHSALGYGHVQVMFLFGVHFIWVKIDQTCLQGCMT